VEYFIDMDQLDLAASAGDALRKFPVDLNALVALGQLETARKNPGGFSEVCGALLPGLAMGSGQTLPWDRRVSLAIVLAQGKRLDLAQGQVRRCLAELDEARLRSLSTSALYRLQVLAKALRLNFPDDRSRQLALALLPPELRQRL